MTALNDYAVLHKGALIQCSNPHCNETIGRLAEDLKPGHSKIRLEAGTGQGTRIDKLPRCKICNFKWFVSETDLSRIHTARGWYPSEEQMVAAMYANAN